MKENQILKPFQEDEEEEDEGEEFDRLSFCNLPIEVNNSGSILQSPVTPSAGSDHLFEFCKIIPDEVENEEDQLNEYQKRDYFAIIRSESFRNPDLDGIEIQRLSASTRFSGDLNRPRSQAGDLDYHVQRVNITSLTSMSAKSRRRMFMFGPVKFKPEMELSAIKQRQSRRATAESGGGKSQWGIVRSSLRGRSHLTSVLARSLGCIPVGGGGERWVGVAN